MHFSIRCSIAAQAARGAYKEMAYSQTGAGAVITPETHTKCGPFDIPGTGYASWTHVERDQVKAPQKLNKVRKTATPNVIIKQNMEI